MEELRFFEGITLPLERHKVRIVQKLNLPDVDSRLSAMNEAGNNTFLLRNDQVFLDMLTDSGVNAMSDRQLAAMMAADDSYAGSMSFERLREKVFQIFGKPFVLPVHQGRAAEHILATAMVKSGDVVPMNYHFTTTRAHIERMGGSVAELFLPEALELESSNPFKGNMDTTALTELLNREKGHVPFVRVEAGTNLLGGQPWSLENLAEVSRITHQAGLPLVLDASLLADNLFFIKTREDSWKNRSVAEIITAIATLCDVIYFSARKLGCARGGLILTDRLDLFETMKPLITLFEGFLTYGGMSVREIEALTVGLEETLDMDMIRQGPEFIAFMVDQLVSRGVPVVTPAGGLGCHLNARDFLPHISATDYPAGALASALFIASGARGMERGTVSEERNADGSEHPADVELLRLALPRRVFTLSQILYVVDRIAWLFKNRHLVGGLEWQEEPKILRFFTGRLTAKVDWQQQLVAQYKADLGNL